MSGCLPYTKGPRVVEEVCVPHPSAHQPTFFFCVLDSRGEQTSGWPSLMAGIGFPGSLDISVSPILPLCRAVAAGDLSSHGQRSSPSPDSEGLGLEPKHAGVYVVGRIWCLRSAWSLSREQQLCGLHGV